MQTSAWRLSQFSILASGRGTLYLASHILCSSPEDLTLQIVAVNYVHEGKFYCSRALYTAAGWSWRASMRCTQLFHLRGWLLAMEFGGGRSWCFLSSVVRNISISGFTILHSQELERARCLEYASFNVPNSQVIRTSRTFLTSKIFLPVEVQLEENTRLAMYSSLAVK